MLVLTRKMGEVICVGPDVKLHVVSIRGNRIRIGIEAPDDMVIQRLEIVQEPKDEK